MYIEKIKFSIIMPTFNRGKTVGKAIKSVLEQTYTNWEVLVIDNGSTDNTKEIISEICRKEPRIRYYYCKEKGVSKSRNFGIKMAEGSFICFLDDDDLYLKHFLETIQMSILENNYKEAFYKSFSILRYSSGNEVRQEIKLYKDKDVKVDYLLNFMTPIHCICLKKETLERLNFDETLEVAEDCHLWLRIVAELPIICVPFYTSIYNLGEMSASAGSIQNYKRYIQSYKYIFDDKKIKGLVTSDMKKKVLGKQYKWLMMEYAKEKKIIKSFKTYFSIVCLTRSFKDYNFFLAVVKTLLSFNKQFK